MLRAISRDKLAYRSVMVALLVPGVCLAEDLHILDPGEQFLQEEVQKRKQQELEQPPTYIKPNFIEKPAILPKNVCFPVHSITLSGTNLISEPEKQLIFKRYLGHCFEVNDINNLTIDLTNKLIEKGYITTRVYVAPQDLKSGKLELQAVEGRIQDFQLQEQITHWKKSGKLLTAFPNVTGKTLNIRDIEQGLDQMNRLASSNATVSLWPGEQDGTSIIKIENQPTDEFRSYIGFDNNGSTATGKHRAKLIFEKDNLLGLNDNLQLSILGNKQVKALAFHTSLPYGYWTMDLDHSLSQYYYSVSKTKINGIGNNHNITLSRLIHRNQTSKTIINTALSIKDAQREIFKIKAPLPKLVVGRIGSSFSQRIASGIITCSGNFSRGLTSFEAAKDHKPFTKTRPRAQFSKIDYQIGLNYHFANQIQFKSNFYGQRSFHALYDSEQFNLSDSSLVRGFGVQNISGNNGVALRNELHLKLPNLLNNIPVKVTTALQAFIFIDLGRAKSSIDNKANRLISVGLGLNAQLGNLTGNFTLAKPTFASRDISKRGVELLFNVLVKTF